MFGMSEVIELKPGGNSIEVTDANKVERVGSKVIHNAWKERELGTKARFIDHAMGLSHTLKSVVFITAHTHVYTSCAVYSGSE